MSKRSLALGGAVLLVGGWLVSRPVIVFSSKVPEPPVAMPDPAPEPVTIQIAARPQQKIADVEPAERHVEEVRPPAPEPQLGRARVKLEASDHVESTDGQDHGQLKGDPGPAGASKDAVTAPTPPAPAEQEIIGVGAGSGGGRRYGGRFGGKQASHAEALPPAKRSAAENVFKKAYGDDATSTFGVDVDTASYAFVKRFLKHEQLPPAEMVRTEEMLNHFDFESPAPPTDGRPFATSVEVASCPWRPENRLVRIALRGREIERDNRPVSNLVFLIDVSGSMSPPERLPLLKQALRMLVEQLGEKDRVAIVVYAGASGLVLPPTSGSDRTKILDALDGLRSGGSTNGGAGIQLAYTTAIASFIEGGVNRVILCTDGDFNVGVSSPEELERVIVEKKKSGVFLSALGFGVDAHGDKVMSTLADKGDGHYKAIHDVKEARRALVDEMSGTLVTIAKDAKIQVAWNPARVKGYRLIGYEKRALANRDFKDDTKDAGDIGAGHRVTALYEVEPASAKDAKGELLTLRLRWKAPDAATSTEVETKASDDGRRFEDASADFKHAASVAAAGMMFTGSPHKGDATFARALAWARAGKGADARGDRAEWIDLLERAARLAGEDAGTAAKR